MATIGNTYRAGATPIGNTYSTYRQINENTPLLRARGRAL